MTAPVTAQTVAQYMVGKLQGQNMLCQDRLALEIEQNFGVQFVYRNPNGNRAIAKVVLKAFRKLTENDVVWMRSDQCWRLRRPTDPPGRMVE